MEDWAKQIEEDLDWREAELASFKILINSALKGSVRESALLRAIWALLYAHYEGFCKFAWDLYLGALEKEGVPRSACQDDIACLSVESDFKRLRGDLASKSIWSFCTSEFQRLMSEPAVFQTKLETEHNLWPNIFRENSRKIALPTTMVDEHERRIAALVKRRNEIAHGQKMIIEDIDEYQEYEDSAFLVMHELAINIIEALDERKYLKSTAKS